MKLLDIVSSLFGKKETSSSVVPPSKVTDGEYRISHSILETKKKNHIICNGEPVEIAWNKVVLWDEQGGLSCSESQYRKRLNKRKPKMFVLHWDACLSSRSMANVLKDRGLSVHFAIDNDGTIYQLMDTKHVAWHAKGINNHSVGVEIANAVLPKHQKWYEENGFGPRPMIDAMMVHGKKLSAHLGFYPVQVAAVKALIKAVSDGHNIPLATPHDREGRPVMGVSSRVAGRTFKGIVGHFHVTTKKVDPAGLRLDAIVDELREEQA